MSKLQSKLKTTTETTMKKDDGYSLNPDFKPECLRFRFKSEGDKGTIDKIIEFTYTPKRPWNLGFGDVKGDDWEDDVISNNNDFRKILQTVANAIHEFCDIYPNNEIAIIPLDEQRKLLYNRVFQQRWLEIETLFIVKAVDLKSESPAFEQYNPKRLFDLFVIMRKY